jgi:Golgi SNAP receptor complex protein 1
LQLAQKISRAANDPLASAEEGQSVFDEESTLQPELQRLVQRLQDLISGRLSVSASSSSQQAAVKRYREILLDLRADFDKSVVVVRRAKDRQELLVGSAGKKSSSQQDPAMEHLMRERNHIQNSMNAADNVIGQADSIRQDLYGQGRSLRSTNTIIGTMVGNIPGLNHLVEQIRRKRSRDDKIVAGVIASCVAFTLWYIFG